MRIKWDCGLFQEPVRSEESILSPYTWLHPWAAGGAQSLGRMVFLLASHVKYRPFCLAFRVPILSLRLPFPAFSPLLFFSVHFMY